MTRSWIVVWVFTFGVEAVAQEGAFLSVRVTLSEKGLGVRELLGMTLGGTDVEFPLLLPLELPGPEMRERGPNDRDGIETAATEGTSVRVTPTGIRVSGQPGRPAEVEVQYTVPVRTGRSVFLLRPGFPLEQVQIETRQGLHVRPLGPYAYREVSGADGIWRQMVMASPVKDQLKVAVSHLPGTAGPYKKAALGLVLLALALGAGFRAGQ